MQYVEISPDRLRSARGRRLLTQARLSEASGVSISNIERLEAGNQPKRVRLTTARQIADALEVEPEEILGVEAVRA